MAALDLLGRRWTLRVLWELRAAPLGFREPQAQCDGMSSSVLRTRLIELAEENLVAQDAAGYRLTPIGAELVAAIGPLSAWAERWKRARR
jgi:DNA-binding HxlR family transcriptional regulator